MDTFVYKLPYFRDNLNMILKKNIKFILGIYDTTVLDQLLNELREDLLVGVETDYVDSMFRDEYYTYFGTKLHSYGRNCIKLSFFNDVKDENDGNSLISVLDNGYYIIKYENHDIIEDNYLGFAIIRPAMACLGRNVISPEAFKKERIENIETCQVTMRISALGLEVKAKGFPHCTQDREMMSCAETTLWAIAEYFGHKYSTYKSVLPSDIIEALRLSYNHRMLPSLGLSFDQISFGLMSFGFSPLHYQLSTKRMSADNDPNDYEIDEEQKEILTCYVESGFPLALCFKGKRDVISSTENESDYIVHAAVCIGRKRINASELKSQIICVKKTKTQTQKVLVKVWNHSINEFVVNDDNESGYMIVDIKQPYEKKREWKEVKITDFIVPLPSRVYMDAYLAIKTSKTIYGNILRRIVKVSLKKQEEDQKKDPDSVPAIRTFLASGRSFRKHVACSDILDPYFKNLLLFLDLPHFIWVSELGTSGDFKNGVIKGLIILDATESPKIKNGFSIKDNDIKMRTPQPIRTDPSIVSHILYVYQDKIVYYDPSEHKLLSRILSADLNNTFQLAMYKENIHDSKFKPNY